MPKLPDLQSQSIVAIDRATDVLSLFASTGEATLGVTEIANALNLSKAVVYRILTSFRAKGYVELDPANRRYSLGPAVLHVGLAYLNRLDVPALARPVLTELSRATNETATLSLRSGDARIYVDQVTPDRDVKMVVQIGRQQPLHAGASSKVLLAFLPDDERDEYLSAALDPVTARTVTDPAKLRKELEQIRNRGWAASTGERMEGASSVAAPVLGHDGTPLAVISICGPMERFGAVADQAAEVLVDATQGLSRQVGWRA